MSGEAGMVGHPVMLPVAVNLSVSLDGPLGAIVRTMATDGMTMQDVVATAIAEDARVRERMTEAVAGALALYCANHPEAWA